MLIKFKKIFANSEARKSLLSSLLVMAAMGIIYIWSVFIIPLEMEFGWPRNKISLVFTTTMICLSLGLAFGGFIHKRLSVRKLLGLAICILSLAFIITSKSQNLFTMIVFYGAICGAFMGVIYNLIIYTCNLWFSKDISATVSGLLQTCLAISTVFLGYFAAALLEIYDWRIVIRVIGALFILSLICACKFLKQPDGQCSAATQVQLVNVNEEGLNWKQMLATRSFWLFWIIRLAILSGGVGAIGHAVPIALEMGTSYQKAIFALGMLSFCNGIGRLLFGIIWDFAGLKKTIALDIIVFIIAYIILSLSPVHKNPYMILLAFCLCGFSYGGANLMCISFTRTVFGLKHFAENYGFNSSSMILSSFMGPFIMGEIKLATGSYHDSFTFFIGFGLFALICLLLIKKTNYTN